MTKNNNKSVLVALLLAPLLTAGFTVGNIPQAEAVPLMPFAVSLECEEISHDTIQWDFGITNLGEETFPFDFHILIESSTGIIFDDGGVAVVDAGVMASTSFVTTGEPDVYFGTLTGTNEIGEEHTDTADCAIFLPPPPPPTPEEKI